MPYEPRSTDDIYESIRESATNKIARLSNFTERSFNYVWARAFSREIRELEVKALAAEFAGWVDYAGGPITESDLEQLGLADDVDAEAVDAAMDERFLDEYVKIVGVERFEGQRATGTVTIDTQSAETTIPSGTRVTTEPDSTGATIDFLTTKEVSTADGVTRVTDVPIQAADVGAEYNLPADTVIRFDNPPVGVRGVTNPTSTTGGEERESNDEFRARAKDAVPSSANGGTTDGIKGYIRKNVEGVGQGDIIIDENIGNSNPVNVIVDGGLDEDVVDAIEFSRPTGVRHTLVRPQVIQFGADIRLEGTALNTSAVEEALRTYLLGLSIDDDVYRDKLVKQILDADRDIVNIDNIGGFIERVTDEQFTYDSSRGDYRLDFTYEQSNGSITVTDDEGVEYVEGSDFDVVDVTGDGWPETIRWIGGTPTDGQQFSVSYDVTVPGQTDIDNYHDISLIRDEPFNWNLSYTESEDYETTQDVYPLDHVPFADSVSIIDNSGDSYTRGTDFELVDDTGNGFKQSIDWSIGGSRPDDNEVFTTTYDQRVYVTEYDIVEAPDEVIRDNSGDTYTIGDNYELVEYESTSSELNAIRWLNRPANLTDGEEFYFTYINQGDRSIEQREKADPGTIDATEV